MVVPWKTICAVGLELIGAAGAWQFQNWRYGKQLADQARLHTETLNQLTMAAVAAQQDEQDKRLAGSEKTYFEKMTDAQKDQDCLRF